MSFELAGYVVLRYRWHEVTHEPGRVAREIRAALVASTRSG